MSELDVNILLFAGACFYLGLLVYSVQTLFWERGVAGQPVHIADLLVIPVRHVFKLVVAPYVFFTWFLVYRDH